MVQHTTKVFEKLILVIIYTVHAQITSFIRKQLILIVLRVVNELALEDVSSVAKADPVGVMVGVGVGLLDEFDSCWVHGSHALHFI